VRVKQQVESKEKRDARFVEALRAHRQSMYRVAFSMTRSAADAEDAVSQATLNAYEAAGRVRDWGAIKAYLLRVTVNACHDILRKRKKEQAADTDALLRDRAAAEETPVWMYTQQLPLKLRLVLEMRYGEGLGLQDIAGILRVPRGTVSSRLSRAQDLLKQLMEKEG